VKSPGIRIEFPAGKNFILKVFRSALGPSQAATYPMDNGAIFQDGKRWPVPVVESHVLTCWTCWHWS